MNIEKDFIKMTEDKRAKIDAIANALKFSTTEPKIAETILPDGSKQKVTQLFDGGKTTFSISSNDKNVMTFATKKQLLDYLGE